jgi:hypothetical protein
MHLRAVQVSFIFLSFFRHRSSVNKHMTTQTSFIGSWLVSEYLYTPTGEFAGIIRQRRLLQPQGDVIRVIQHCDPVLVADNVSEQAQATINIMNERVGEFVFDLKLVGKARHYLGEDVIGGGFSWKDGVLTAKGMWTRFRYNFTSFSILLNSHRQVTGGKFFIANQEVATLVGVAVPEDEGYPEFEDGNIADKYTGERYTISPDGEWLETTQVITNEHTFTDKEGMRGNEKRYGALLEMETVDAPGQTTSAIEVTDHASGSIAGIWKRFQDEKLKQVDVYVLTADDRPQTKSER